MWRKIHSNRDPRDTLYSEIRREFGGYFMIAGGGIKRLLNAHPRTVLGLMVILMLVSGALSFTVFRQPESKKADKVRPLDPIGDGFTQILQTAENIRESMRLKQRIDSLSAKRVLTTADSTALENALDSLQHLNH